MALSGSFNNYVTSQFGLRCNWFGKQNFRTNSTDLTVRVYLRYNNIVIGKRSGSISVGGTSAAFISPQINAAGQNMWSNMLLSTFTTTIKHNPDGSIPAIPLSAHWNFCDIYNGKNYEVIKASSYANLDAIKTYSLSTTLGYMAFASIERTASGVGTIGSVADGEILYYGDRLKISFSTDEYRRISTHSVNGETFPSGGMIVVDKDISVVSKASVIIKQSFDAYNMRCLDAKGRTFKSLYQWDKDVTIIIKDKAIYPTPVFHFANRRMNETISVLPSVSGKDLKVTIPNVLLERAGAVFAHIYCGSDSGEGRTLGSIYIPVWERKKTPSNISMNTR